MPSKTATPSIRILPETVANKIAAGEVVERPGSVVKELVENALDAQATRIIVRLVAAGRRTIEVIDNGHGMSEQDALLSIERHATSKIRKSEDLDDIRTMGFRGEALASIAAVSRFELLSRREKDDSATRIRVEGGILRDVSEAAGPVGTRVTVSRLYFNTPARAKFLKGIATELSQCVDIVQRHALAHEGVGFQLLHNEKLLLDIPDHASLRERIALIWGLTFLRDMVDFQGEHGGFRLHGLIGTPALTRSHRSHQFFFLNRRPVVNRSLQYGFEEGYRGLLTIGRYPVGIVMVETHPRLVDVNVHPTKREIRFRDDRGIREALRELVRARMEELQVPEALPTPEPARPGAEKAGPLPAAPPPKPQTVEAPPTATPSTPESSEKPSPPPERVRLESDEGFFERHESPQQTVFPGSGEFDVVEVEPEAVYRPVESMANDLPIQLFDTYLLVPEEDRLLIIDQHALHERLNYDMLRQDLEENDYESQQLAVPLLVDVPPSHAKLLDSNLKVFKRLGIEIESFGGNTYQITAICHLYEESKVPDIVFRVLDTLAQGDLFDREDFMSDLLRLATEACRASIKAGDRLSPEERRSLLDGFRRLRPPYTCPHGRPIITELTQFQMEKSFRRRQ